MPGGGGGGGGHGGDGIALLLDARNNALEQVQWYTSIRFVSAGYGVESLDDKREGREREREEN